MILSRSFFLLIVLFAINLRISRAQTFRSNSDGQQFRSSSPESPSNAMDGPSYQQGLPPSPGPTPSTGQVLSAYGSEFPSNHGTHDIQVKEDISNGCTGKLALPATDTFANSFTSVMAVISSLQTYVNGNVTENFFPLDRASPGTWVANSATYTAPPSLGGNGFVFPRVFGSNPTSSYSLSLTTAGVLTISENGSGMGSNMLYPNISGQSTWTGSESIDLNTGAHRWNFRASFQGTFDFHTTGRLARTLHCTLEATTTAIEDRPIPIILNHVMGSGENCTATAGPITSAPFASVPGTLPSRTCLGVGESVLLTSKQRATWTVTSNSKEASLASDSQSTKRFPYKTCAQNVMPQGAPVFQACLTAPFKNDRIVVTATFDDHTSASKVFTVLQPTGLVFQRLKSPPLPIPGYGFQSYLGGLAYKAQMYSAAFVTPGNVSFANIGIAELDRKPPYSTPVSHMLVPFAGTNAWLLSCDFDGNTNTFPGRYPVVWDYTYGSDNFVEANKVPFSLTQTHLSHIDGQSYVYNKVQIQSLSANGVGTDTPGALEALLTVPEGAPDSFLDDLGTTDAQAYQVCFAFVQKQFGSVH